MRPLWPLEAGAVYLNHGTVGVTLRAVLAAQAEIRDEIERQPARFMLREVKDRLRAAAERVAGVLGGQGRDYVFTDNATTGINAVLRSTPLRPGDEVLVTDHTYGAVRNAAAYACRQAGATLRTNGYIIYVTDSDIQGTVEGLGDIIIINPPTPGDANGDGVVNIQDILVIIADWGTCTENCAGDVNADGDVNILDILLVIANWTF